MNSTSGKPDFSNVKGDYANAPTEKTEADSPDFRGVDGGFASPDTVEDADVAMSTYTVQRGDSLSRIAKTTYGKSSLWQLIFEANRDQLDNPDLIHPGQTLKIPPVPEKDA